MSIILQLLGLKEKRKIKPCSWQSELDSGNCTTLDDAIEMAGPENVEYVENGVIMGGKNGG